MLPLTETERVLLDALGIDDEMRGRECDLCRETENVAWVMARTAWLCCACRDEYV